MEQIPFIPAQDGDSVSETASRSLSVFFLESPVKCPSDRILAEVVEVLRKAGGLTDVRSKVLELLLLGRQYTEIAKILGKSPNTVASQVKAILHRLGADSTRDLFRIYLMEVDRNVVRSHVGRSCRRD